VRPVEYDPRLPLFWSLGFNFNPMCSVIGQRQGEWVFILDELVLPDSHTGAACEEFLARTERLVGRSRLPVQLDIYGDATGESQKSSDSRTDWQIVQEFLNYHRDLYRTTFRVGSSNPPVRDRVNCVNAKLRNQAGERRLVVDSHCKQLIEDFERVHWKTDPSGNTLNDIDKSDLNRTHVSDALGYMIAREFPMYAKFDQRQPLY
jgi:hypothetical protein